MVGYPGVGRFHSFKMVHQDADSTSGEIDLDRTSAVVIWLLCICDHAQSASRDAQLSKILPIGFYSN